LAQQQDIGARGVKRLGLGPCGIGPRTFFSQSRQLRFKGSDAGFSARIACGQFTFCTARGRCRRFGRATCVARSGFGAGGFRFGGFGGDARGFRFRCRHFGLIQPRFSRA